MLKNFSVKKIQENIGVKNNPPYLPLLILSVVRKKLHYPIINFGECHHFVGRLLDGHRDQRNIRIWRFRLTHSIPLILKTWICGLILRRILTNSQRRIWVKLRRTDHSSRIGTHSGRGGRNHNSMACVARVIGINIGLPFLHQFLLQQFFLDQFFLLQIFFYNNFFLHQFFLLQIFLQQIFFTSFFLQQIFFTSIFFTTNLFYNKFFLQQIFFTTNFFYIKSKKIFF